ncbi:MAG: FHA domain-containing protein [Gammaproteobacteria bacterium]|nr:FHA domain-containing protein [Gammaproteobacteria bacterium]
MILPPYDEPDQHFWDKVVSWVSTAPPAPEEHPPLTYLLILLDRSGSMEALRDDTIGGFNAFLEQQKAAPGSATLTLTQFDTQNPYEIVYADQPLDAAPPLTRATFVPRGGTPLLDALGQSLLDLEQRQTNRPAEAHPASVIVAIITDGQENASRRFQKPQILAMIQEKQAIGWQFVFLSADLDAVREARHLGFREDTVMGFSEDARGMTEAWTTLSTSVTAFRTGDRSHLSLRRGPEPIDHQVFPSAEAALDAFYNASKPALRERQAALHLCYRNRLLTLGPSTVDFHIGRHPGNDLIIDAPLVSRRHLRLTGVDDQWVLRDSSTNGTHLLPEAGDRQKVHQQAVVVQGRGLMSLGQASFAENPDVIHYARVVADPVHDAGPANSQAPKTDPASAA